MSKRDTDRTHIHEEVIITLPASALDALGTLLSGQLKSGYDATKGDIYMSASPVGRDEPFPCFMKSNWDGQAIVKVVQQRRIPSAA